HKPKSVRMKKLLQSLFLMLLVAGTAIAQERTVTGTVTDKTDGLPLPGVSVKVNGTNLGTTTGGNGTFSIRVPSGSSSLTVSYVGYVQQTVSIGTSSNVRVSMAPDAQILGEVIVNSYGSQTKKEFTGAAS